MLTLTKTPARTVLSLHKPAHQPIKRVVRSKTRGYVAIVDSSVPLQDMRRYGLIPAKGARPMVTVNGYSAVQMQS